MIQYALYSLLIILLQISVFLYLKEKQKNKTILASTLQLLIMQEVGQEQNKTDKEKANEDFLKFVSDSRDWAYEYIESAQEAIKNFIDEAGPSIEYWDEYGSVIATPLDDSMKKISDAYKKIKVLIPESDAL
jgi:hypothetical protein